MLEIIGNFIAANSSLCIVAATLLGLGGLSHWRRVRMLEMELAAKRDWLDQGLSPTEVQVLLAATSSARRGWLEQFGQLSGGAKAGVIIGLICIAVPLGSGAIGIIANYHFWQNVREQQRYNSATRPFVTQPVASPPVASPPAER